MPDAIIVEVSPGELIDKITILEIKLSRVDDEEKHRNVLIEWETLTTARDAALTQTDELKALTQSLENVNRKLWDIEDGIRQCERDGDFSKTFIELARAVYISNDKRAALKKEINLLLGSDIVEEKTYVDY